MEKLFQARALLFVFISYSNLQIGLEWFLALSGYGIPWQLIQVLHFLQSAMMCVLFTALLDLLRWYTSLDIAFIKVCEWLLLRFNLTLSESALSILEVWSEMNGSEKKGIIANFYFFFFIYFCLSLNQHKIIERGDLDNKLLVEKGECFLSKIATH